MALCKLLEAQALCSLDDPIIKLGYKNKLIKMRQISKLSYNELTFGMCYIQNLSCHGYIKGYCQLT